MAYDRQYLRLTCRFQDASSNEEAQTGLRLSGGPTFDAMAALADPTDSDLISIVHTLATTMGGGSFGWANYSQAFGLKLAAVGTDGHDLTDPREVTDGSPLSGATAGIHPQLSICVGLWSGHKFGVANYGKMYLPHTATPLVASTSVSSAGSASSVCTDMKAWLNGLMGVTGGWTGSPIVVVMSPKLTGTTKGVTTVRCGEVTDTQRRRRDSLNEAYSALVL